MIFGLENVGKNSPVILYSMIDMSVCLGNEEEDGEEGEDEKHGHVQLLAPHSRRRDIAAAFYVNNKADKCD
jgi:hypothetical protein